jgi:hypothetical protein
MSFVVDYKTAKVRKNPQLFNYAILIVNDLMIARSKDDYFGGISVSRLWRLKKVVFDSLIWMLKVSSALPCGPLIRMLMVCSPLLQRKI